MMNFSQFFLVFLPPPTYAQVPAERNKVLSASRWPKWPPSTKKTNWAPGSCANFQEITMESMPVLPLEEGKEKLNKTKQKRKNIYIFKNKKYKQKNKKRKGRVRTVQID
jgi:hypothetical protein